jgi:hypothetical protein
MNTQKELNTARKAFSQLFACKNMKAHKPLMPTHALLFKATQSLTSKLQTLLSAEAFNHIETHQTIMALHALSLMAQTKETLHINQILDVGFTFHTAELDLEFIELRKPLGKPLEPREEFWDFIEVQSTLALTIPSREAFANFAEKITLRIREEAYHDV